MVARIRKSRLLAETTAAWRPSLPTPAVSGVPSWVRHTSVPVRASSAATVPLAEASRFGIMNTREDGQIYEFDARPGGTYRMALTYRGDHENRGKTAENMDIVEGRFIEFAHDEKAVHAVTFESEDPAFAGDRRMTWSLSPAPAGTELTITCENVPFGISKADHDVGLRSTLANLATFME